MSHGKMFSSLFIVAILLLCSGVLSTPVAPHGDLIEARRLQKRDLGQSICGCSTCDSAADENRNPATWRAFKMDDWYANFVKPYVISNWGADLHEARPPTNIQDVILRAMGNSGAARCEQNLKNVKCTVQGLDWGVCLQHPEAFYVYFAITYFADYLSNMWQSWETSVVALTPQTGTLRSQFFTPEAKLDKVLVPVGVVSGVAGAIAGFYGPLSVVAGLGSVVNAMITQAGLDKVDPTEQWSLVQDAIGSAFKQITPAVAELFKHTLWELPNEDDNPITYDVDPTQTPMMFRDGAFGGQVTVPAIQPGIMGALAASAINALWTGDGVFMIQISDSTYGGGTRACDRFPAMTVCSDDGKTAYIWARWQWKPASKNKDSSSAKLDTTKWNVWGAYKQGSAGGSDNDNHLSEYGLDLGVITKSVLKTWKVADGFPFTNQNGATIKQIQSDPKNLDVAALMFFSIPICDLDAVSQSLGGKTIKSADNQFNDDPVVSFGGCSCQSLFPKWVKDSQLYAPNSGALSADSCKKNGWGA